MSSSTGNTFVDNADPSITYYPGADTPWYFLGISGNPNIYDGSLSEIEGVGGCSFTFTGSQISVYGSVGVPQHGDGPAVSQYAIDDGTPTVYIAEVPANEADGVLFYASPVLPLGQHRLVINVTDATATSPYLLDYLSYSTTQSSSSSSPASSSSSSSDQPLSSSSSSSSQSSSSSSASSDSSSSNPTSSSPESSSSDSASTSSSVVTVSSPVSSSSLSSSSSSLSSSSSSTSLSPTSIIGAATSDSSSKHVGAIVGGVVGCIVALVLVVLFLFFWRRQRRSRSNDDSYHYTPATQDTVRSREDVNPFLTSPHSLSTVSMSQSQRGENIMVSTIPNPSSVPLVPNRGPGFGSDYGEHTQSSAQSPNGTGSATPSDALETTSEGSMSVRGSGSGSGKAPAGMFTRTLTPPPTQHADSGVRFGPRTTPSVVAAPADIPPIYTPD